MVTQSTVNWRRHLVDVENVLSQDLGKKHANIFIKFYRSRYDVHQRSFINYRLAVRLLQDYADTKMENGSRFYGFFGPGGAGKSTLAKNIFYFLDPEFNHGHLHRTVGEFTEDISNFPLTKALRATMLDEPDNTYHPNSPIIKKIREMFGEMRQQWLFTGVCATDLADVQGFWWKKFTGIFFVKKISAVRGRAWYFKDDPYTKQYPVQWIKRYWNEKMYNTFEEAIYKFNVPYYDIGKHIPFTHHEERDYIDKKAQSYGKTMKDVLKLIKKNSSDPKEIKQQWQLKRNQLIYSEWKKGQTQKDIAIKYNMTEGRISQICNEMQQT